MEHTDAGEQLALVLTREELLLLAGLVNEAVNAVEDWEFSTRLGAEKGAARELRNALRSVIAQLPPAD